MLLVEEKRAQAPPTLEQMRPELVKFMLFDQIQSVLKKLRDKANELLDARWPRGYVSYISTLCEVPDISFEETVDGVKVYTFSPKLTPTLFEDNLGAKHVWAELQAHKRASQTKPSKD